MQDGVEVPGGEFLQYRRNRQAAYEFGFEAVFDQIFGRDLLEEGARRFPGGHLAVEADLLLAEALLDDLVQNVEGAADDEEDMAGVEGALLFLAGAP